LAGYSGGSNRDPPFLLLLHEIHRGLTVVDLPDLPGCSGKKENPFRYGGFSCINMGGNANVPESGQLHKVYFIGGAKVQFYREDDRLHLILFRENPKSGKFTFASCNDSLYAESYGLSQINQR
jgi:hypothetical protein